MLRPATPLSVLYFIAFLLLLLSTLSTPIIKGIPLASFNGVTFGVFGYCNPKGCIQEKVGYSVESKAVFETSSDNSAFSLAPNTRSDLSSILIVHPVAALLTLICLILAATSHLHSPSHSPRYLLGLIILSVPTLLITLLAFLVDILLFFPHVAWGGWIVLASTILILASSIVTCAMRRTLVSRKARKKRIAENAEMNGENFYARQAAPPMMAVDRADSPPPLPPQVQMSGGLGSDKLPKFATFETSTGSEDDRTPLNQRTPSNKTLPSMPNGRGGFADYGGPVRGPPGGMRGGRGGYNVPRDEYGNPLPPSNAFSPAPPAGMRRNGSEPPRMRRQYSDEAMNSQGFRGRGRGGYGPPRGYGRGGPGYAPGPGPGRAGHGRGGIPMGAMAAGAGAGMMAGERRQGQDRPPPGYGNGYPPSDRPGQYDGPNPAGFGRSPSAPAYGRRPSPGPPSVPGGYGRQPSQGPPSAPGGYRRPSPGPPSAPGAYRRPSPGPPSAPGGYGYANGDPQDPPVQQYRGGPSPTLPIAHADPEMIGQAVEMDARHGSPSLRSPNFPPPMGMQLRDSDSDVQGLVGLQQQNQARDSEASAYGSQEPYVPPRAAWTGMSRGVIPPSNTMALDPVELPTQTPRTVRKHRHRSSSLPNNDSPRHTRNQPSGNYYEDVDPRFASPTEAPVPTNNAVPSSLTPGFGALPTQNHQTQYQNPHQSIQPTIEYVDPSSSYESIQDGQRSPASDNSGMTSISQRGVNPNWNPPPENYQGQTNLGVPPRRRSGQQQQQYQQQQQRDMVLQSNPDFELGHAPGVSASGGRIPPPHLMQGQAF